MSPHLNIADILLLEKELVFNIVYVGVYNTNGTDLNVLLENESGLLHQSSENPGICADVTNRIIPVKARFFLFLIFLDTLDLAQGQMEK